MHSLSATKSDSLKQVNQANHRLKTAKVGIRIEQVGNRLVLRATLPPKPGSNRGKPYQQRIYLGVQANSAGLRVAEAKAREISAQLALVTFCWDPYLETDPEQPKQVQLTTLKLWDRFTEYKTPSLQETTLRSTFAKTRNKLLRYSQCISSRLDAIQFRDWLLLECQPVTAKKYLTQMNACFNWAVACELVQVNPFLGLARELKARSGSDPDPFTHDEVNQVLDAFSSDRYYSYYLPYVKFLLLTGARPEEGVGLLWKHIRFDKGEIRFSEAVETSFNVRKNIKTHESRVFPLNQELRALLDPLRAERGDPQEPVFLSKEGKQLNHGNFTRRAWHGITNRHGKWIPGLVMRLADEGKIHHYREPYAMRDTFITHCLEQGLSVVQVAKWVGNSPEVIYRHYAGLVNQVPVPELGFGEPQSGDKR
jgi:integrase